MKTFRYQGLDAAGGRRTGIIEAESGKEALRKLAGTGVFAERVEPLAGENARGMPSGRRAVFYRGLSTLLRAGLPLDRALTLLMGENGAAGTDAAIAPIRDAVCEGRSFAVAVAESEPRLAGYEKAMLEAAERTGSLAEMLAKTADSLDSRRAMAEKLRSAAAYPCFVLALGVAVAFLMLGVLVPMAQRSLTTAGIGLPRASLAIVAGARLVAWIVGGALVLGTAAFVAVSLQCRKSRRMRERVGRFLLHLPMAGRPLRALAAQRFAETLAALIRAGVPLVEGFGLAGAATGNAWIAREAAEQAEEIRNGARVSAGVAGMPELAGALREWVRVGEAAGCMEAMLTVAAERAETVWNRACERAFALIGPVILVCVGVFVLAVALAVLLPVTLMTLQVG